MDTLQKINNLVDERIKPALMADGGEIEVLSFKDGVLKVKFKGACAGCSMRQYTLKNFIEAAIKDAVPEVKKVIL